MGRRDLPDGGNGSMPWGAATCRLVFCASVSRIEACLVAQWVNWRCRMRFLLVFWCRCGFNVPSQGTLHAPLAVIVGLHRCFLGGGWNAARPGIKRQVSVKEKD